MKTQILRLARFLPAVVVASAIHSSLPAALPANGTGWTLTENPNGSWTLVDVVDSTGSWSRERMDWKNGAYDGLNSVVGTNFIVTNGQTGDHHVDRFFDAGITIQEGTYTITFSMGKLDSLAFMSNKFAGLISDSWSWNNRITSGMTIESGPTPNTENKWVTWKITYTVDAETKSAAGTSVVGTRLGFAILASGDGSSSSYAFDNLTIAYTPNSVVPEPATTAALAGMIVLLAVLGFRARRHR